MVTTNTRPKCNYCGNEFWAGGVWLKANYCRAAYLLPIIEQSPGLSSWELSKIANIPFTQVSSALVKARDWNLVTYEAEENEQGGQRYRYKVSDGWEEVVKNWAREGTI